MVGGGGENGGHVGELVFGVCGDFGAAGFSGGARTVDEFFFFVFLFQCVPSQYFWTRFTGGEGTCMPANIVVSSFYGYSAVACVTDWVFSILPCFLVWNLQMGRREKASVMLILATGAL